MDEVEYSICEKNEKKTFIVIIFTLITMVAEIIYGYTTNSMGLLADGYHMLCHALALFLTYIAYVLTRKFAASPLFKNGTGKINTLAAYTSSLFLGVTGIWIIYEASLRLYHPLLISFNEAILIAVIGLTVNFICILIMHDKNDPCKEKEDYNFKSAYYHILADALTSILAIIALVIGKYFNFPYLDSLIGIVGGILIIKWACELIKNTAKILLDIED